MQVDQWSRQPRRQTAAGATHTDSFTRALATLSLAWVGLAIAALAHPVARAATQAPAPARPLVVAVAFEPENDNSNSLVRCQAHTDPLAAALGQPVKLVNSRSLRDIASGIRSGAFDPTPVITHRLPLEAVDEAMHLIKSGEAGKIIFNIG